MMAARRGRRAVDGATDVARVSLCMTPRNRDELQRLADADGISASAMVRKLVNEEISRRELGGRIDSRPLTS